jgi:uncharacterized protein YecE (DUF72 family)
MDTWLRAGVDVFAYFNNDYEGHAVADAEWLRTKLGGAAGRGGQSLRVGRADA